MIIDKVVKIKMNSKHISKYKLLGYNCVVGELTSINIEHLPKYSKCKVKVICDDCGSESQVLYINYTKTIERSSKYRCYDCGRIAIKQTCVEKYGFDNPTKSKEISDKISLNYESKSDYDKKKMKENFKKTIFDKYGDWFTKTDIYKEKLKKTSIENYGIDDYRKSENFKNKVKKTLMSKYGVQNPSQMMFDFKKSWFGNRINGFHELSNLTYQGTYELDFLQKYYNKFTIEKIHPIQYKLNENVHYYHPDFYLPEYNLIVEIKSTYTYEYDLDRNLAKKEYSLRGGYNFLFIIDKDYTELNELIKN